MRSFMFFIMATLGLLTMKTAAKRKDWALLIAGSNNYDNYRHQADVCHAYQIFHKAGIPDEQIVVMMFDDIALNEQNPTPRQIFNRPGGPNVYAGVPKDYTFTEITAKTILSVLQGDRDTVRNLTGVVNKKVVLSGPDDHIFVYYADHGATGVLGTPYPPFLMGRDVVNTLKSMHDKKRFAKLIFYVESGDAGSIFQDLPKDINVYVLTATNANEPNHACYWDKFRTAYLGDVFSVKWMEDTDKANLHKETFGQQFATVKRETNTSHVMQYGDTGITKSTLDEFFGKASNNFQSDNFPSPSVEDAVPSEMVRMQTLKNRINQAPLHSVERTHLQQKLKALYGEMKQTNDLFNNIARTVYSHRPDVEVIDLALKERGAVRNWDCYERALDTVSGSCPKIDGSNELAFRKFYVLANLCNANEEGKVINAIKSAAASSPLCPLAH